MKIVDRAQTLKGGISNLNKLEKMKKVKNF